jgi:hypothetical protein
MGPKSEEWNLICEEMKNKFKANKAYLDVKLLENVWGEVEERQHLIDGLLWKEKQQQAPLQYWMMFSTHNYLLADTYQRPVFYLKIRHRQIIFLFPIPTMGRYANHSG